MLATTIIDQIAYILVRLSFGGNKGLGQHDVLSNMVVDVAQEILDNDTWDPTTLHSPHIDKIPPPLWLSEDIPFGKASPLAMDLDKPHKVYVNGYMDDICTLSLDKGSLPERGCNALALAIHLFFRPINSEDTITREDALGIQKLLAEGRQEELKIILRWLIDTRCFLITLTPDKSEA